MAGTSTKKAATTKETTTKTPAKVAMDVPSELIDARIQDLGDWRGEALSRIRALIKQAVPEVVEEVKWRKPSNSMLGTPVWSHDGIICTGESYKEKVKFTFAKGAALEDPTGLFNASLEGSARRAIDLHKGDAIDEQAFLALVRAAAALNRGAAKATEKKRTSTQRAASTPKLLSGGNPQIPKGDGDGPVQDYIEAMPGWKRDVGRRLDALLVRAVPKVRKAVRWNSPFYGVEGRGWFLSYHCFTRYVRVTFLRGTSLDPLPPGESKHQEVRYLDIHEDARFDEKLVEAWIRQASELPGDALF